MDGIALKPLTVSFSEPGFVAKLNQESQFGPWFTLSDKEKQQLGSPMGPQNPQALNRYSYVLNNPMRWTDPTGHDVFTIGLSGRIGAFFGVSGSIGLSFGTDGSFGWYTSTGSGPQFGLSGSVGLSASWYTSGTNVMDIDGTGQQVGLDTPVLSVDTLGNDKGYAGLSFGTGIGVSANVHGEHTMTNAFLISRGPCVPVTAPPSGCGGSSAPLSPPVPSPSGPVPSPASVPPGSSSLP
jgi:hypothetical protein